LLPFLHDTDRVQERLLRGEVRPPTAVEEAMQEKLRQLEGEINGNGR
jgi:hypothetical protein